MSSGQRAPMRERLAHCIAHLAHILPAQAPIRDFVHHNTLHGFQDQPFPQALATAHALTGASVYWPEARFRACLASGRITQDDLEAALDDSGLDGLDAPVLPGLARRDVLLASLLIGDDPAGASRRGWLAREQPTGEHDFRSAPQFCDSPASPTSAADWETTATAQWHALCQRVGRGEWTWRRLLEYLSGEDVLEAVRSILQRHLAAHLDLGVAAWRNPARASGFFAAWRASAGLDLAWEIDELPNVRDEIAHLPDDPLEVLIEELPRLEPDEDCWPDCLARLALELPGWSGMFLWRDQHPARGDGTPVDMLDWLAVRVLLERLLVDDLLRRLTGEPMGLMALRAHFAARPAEILVRLAVHRSDLPEDLLSEAAYRVALSRQGLLDPAAWQRLAGRLAVLTAAGENEAAAYRLAVLGRRLGGGSASPESAAGAALLACADSLSPLQRGQIWLEAYERHYRQQVFTALIANHGHEPSPAAPSAQVVLCMDDREEGTRRHLEEIAPDVASYGAAGFFGLPMYWQGLDDAARTALCPVLVQPAHLVREVAREGAEGLAERHARRREHRLRWRERLYQATRRQALAGTALVIISGLPALVLLTAETLAPGWLARTTRRWREQYTTRPPTRLQLTAEHAGEASERNPQAGFVDAEQIDLVAGFLRTIGLVRDFAPLVLMLGHGSGSRNNPHLSAYDCGACSGRHGGPNARVFAAMANRPAVRAGLAARGMIVGDDTWFVAAEHNTCDDGIEWYDLDAVPDRFQARLNRLVAQLGEACRAHAVERCRRLASAPVRPTPWQARRHVVGRASDIAQARPELGHATNAAALIGRRQMSRGLFLDRRIFLVSYDPTDDDDGRVVESILLAAGPVGAGIALEYYFSTVDNAHFGSGSKILHNLTGLFGVMAGADSDLRTGLPWQMVEVHEPMRLLVVVEQTPAVLSAVLERQPSLHELVAKGWIVLAAKGPSRPELAWYHPEKGWRSWSGASVLPQVARSADWFAGHSEALPPALIRRGAR